MNKNVVIKISPHFDDQKLRDATISDRILIYEDRINGWLLKWADELNEHEEAGFATLQLALAFFEGFAVFYYGQDSRGKSKDMFGRGLLLTFPSLKTHPNGIVKSTIQNLYEFGRCGLFHYGMVRPGVVLFDHDNALSLVVDRAAAKVVEIRIDRRRFVDTVRATFGEYINDLLTPTNVERRDCFERAWEITHT